MKKLLPSGQSGYLLFKTSWIIGFVFAMTTFISGCKKNDFFSCDRVSEKGKSHVITVHRGGSIQAAVDAASRGTIIKIESGTYKEAVLVDKSGITIIGMSCFSRDKVIIENPGDEDNGINVTAGADGFVLKNVTVRNFKENGVLLTSVDNFLLSEVVAINNGEYGLFPVFCKNGIIEYCTAIGHEDTGIYVGQSESVAIRNCEAHGNVNGIEVENCTDAAVIKNHSYDNVSGLLLILLPGLTVKTSSNVLVEENNFEKNNHVNFADPTGGFEAFVPSGSGILLVGVDNATIKNNKVTNNNFTGIAAVSTVILGALAGLPPEAFADIEPNVDGARIINNLVVNNGAAPPAGLPLPGVDLLWDGNGSNNCWKNNTYATSYPSPLPVCN